MDKVATVRAVQSCNHAQKQYGRAAMRVPLLTGDGGGSGGGSKDAACDKHTGWDVWTESQNILAASIGGGQCDRQTGVRRLSVQHSLGPSCTCYKKV